MVASIKPQRDEVGLAGGRMLIDGHWVAAAGQADLVALRLDGCDHAPSSLD